MRDEVPQSGDVLFRCICGSGRERMPQERNKWLEGKLKGKQSQIYFTICLGPKNDA